LTSCWISFPRHQKSLYFYNTTLPLIKLANAEKKSKHIQDLAEAFQDIRLHSEGKKKLKKQKTCSMSFEVEGTKPFERKLKTQTTSPSPLSS
jgi:hypothetical protein